MNQKQVKFYKIIQTTLGEKLVEDLLPTIKCCLFHQNLSNAIYPKSIERPLTMEHLSFHRSFPLSLQNTSISPGMLEHEIQSLIINRSLLLNELLILDGSPYEQQQVGIFRKIPEIFSKMSIIRGYSYRPKFNQNTKQSQRSSLLSFEYILKQIQYQFKLGNGICKPGFIGEIFLEDFSSTLQTGVLQAYFAFSAQTKCPIIINLCSLGQKSADSYIFPAVSYDLIKNKIKNKLEKLKQMLAINKGGLDKNIVVYNFPFLFEVKEAKIVNLFEENLINIIEENNITLGFDLLRYSQTNITLHSMMAISQLLKKYSSNIIISSGIRYKTDLQNFSGEGLSQYYQSEAKDLCHCPAFDILKQLAEDGLLSQALMENKMNLLSWKIKTEQIKVEVLWKCSTCFLEQPESIQSFRKFGQQFCSVKCLKSYKF